MARMLPELSSARLQDLPSRAEARFYEACRDQLPDDVLVMHSIRWVYRDNSDALREGEADFILVMPEAGIITVEVKGGGVEYEARADDWYSTSRDGQRHKIKDPFQQARKERFAVRDQLHGDRRWREWTGAVMLGHAVVFPDLNDVEGLVGSDRPREIIGVRQDMQVLASWLERVIRFWWRSDSTPLGGQGRHLVEKILSGSVEIRPVLGATLDDTELQRIRLTNNQAKILRTIGGRRRAVICGGAGTGKTLIAVEKARQLANGGNRVLFLCYNRPLADSLSSAMATENRIEVMNFHQLCDRRAKMAKQQTGRDLVREAEEAYPGASIEHKFDTIMPYALLLANEVLLDKYDAIVVDEAQDFSDDYWVGIEELLRDAGQGFVYLFMDQNQALYRIPERLPVADEPFHLTVNCRNTKPIHNLGYMFYRGEPVDAPELVGLPVQRLEASTDELQADAIQKRVGELVEMEGLPPSDIAVLIAKRGKAGCYGLLKDRTLPRGARWAMESREDARQVLVDTVARFKGLEAQAVVLWLGDDVVDSQSWDTTYVGATRAKSLLCLVGTKHALKGLHR